MTNATMSIPCACGGVCMLCDDNGMMHPSIEDAAEAAALDEAMAYRDGVSPATGMPVESAALHAWSVASETLFLDVDDGPELEHAFSVFVRVFEANAR